MYLTERIPRYNRAFGNHSTDGQMLYHAIASDRDEYGWSARGPRRDRKNRNY